MNKIAMSQFPIMNSSMIKERVAEGKPCFITNNGVAIAVLISYDAYLEMQKLIQETEKEGCELNG